MNSQLDPYESVSTFLGYVNEWRIEQLIRDNPQWAKYPFADGAANILYRFSLSPQVQRMLALLRGGIERDWVARQRARRLVIERDEFIQLLPHDMGKRDALKKRIMNVGYIL